VRSDYISYLTAIVCFLLAIVVFATTQTYLDGMIRTALTGILAILGLIMIAVGYSQRPKEIMLHEATQPQEKKVSMALAEPAKYEIPLKTEPIKPAPEPAPEPIQEPAMPTTVPESPVESVQMQEEEKPAKKTARRRRKKA